MPTEFQCEFVSWGKIASLATELAQQIRQDGFVPDIIIAIGRGGYVPARMLADYLDLMDLTSIRIEHYLSGADQQRSATIKFPLNTDVSGMNVLVVDDVSDSGDTFELALQHIRELSQPAMIKTAALHHKTVSRFIPDYYAAKIIKWRWLIYPWAQVEDIRGFITKLSPSQTDRKKAAAQLEQAYGIRVPDRLLDYVLATSSRA